MGNFIFNTCIAHKGKDTLKKSTFDSVLNISAKGLMENASSTARTISEHLDAPKKAILFVNVATKWGLTKKNYE